jgi:hypothetical protein
MPKYRLLTIEELQALEKEFIEYLVVNGISSTDWTSLKEEQPASAERIIELFSDLILGTILKNVGYLEKRGKNHLHVFQCLKEDLVLVAMEGPNQEEIDFTNPDFISSSMLTPPSSLQVYTTQKPYTLERELELFKMIEEGCVITQDKLFKALCLAL